MRLVVDASAVVKGAAPFADAELRRAWEDLLVEHEAVAPALLLFEAGNVVHRKRPEAFGRDVASREAALGELLEGVRVLPVEPGDLGAIARVCEEEALSFYDATYLELAERDDESILVSADERLLKAAARRLGNHRARALG